MIKNETKAAVEVQEEKEETLTAAQARADSLLLTVTFLRSAVKRDSTLLKWVQSDNRTNTTGSAVMSIMEQVLVNHGAAKIGRTKYVHFLKAKGTTFVNRTTLLRQLDEEVMGAVPQYGKKMLNDPLTNDQCFAVFELSNKCPSHFGCNTMDTRCVSCADSGSCARHQAEAKNALF